MKILSVHPFSALKFINLNTVDNTVKLVEPVYNGVSSSVVIFSYRTLAKVYTLTWGIMSFNLLSIVEYTSSCVSATLGVSTNSPCHIHVV